LFLGYPVPGQNNETSVGQRSYNIVWYRPTDATTALADLCTDAHGQCHSTAIAPPLIRPAAPSRSLSVLAVGLAGLGLVLRARRV
jgi:hypothetical protein